MGEPELYPFAVLNGTQLDPRFWQIGDACKQKVIVLVETAASAAASDSLYSTPFRSLSLLSSVRASENFARVIRSPWYNAECRPRRGMLRRGAPCCSAVHAARCNPVQCSARGVTAAGPSKSAARSAALRAALQPGCSRLQHVALCSNSLALQCA